MGAGVIEDDVDLEFLGHVAVDPVEEGAQLARPLPREGPRRHLARRDVQGRVQRRGAVALVVMGPAFHLTARCVSADADRRRLASASNSRCSAPVGTNSALGDPCA